MYFLFLTLPLLTEHLWAQSNASSHLETPPNVIIIMTDDQGYGDFGIHGNDIIETPTINRFASRAVRFERFYVSPVCAPTRAALLTGRYYLRTGVSGVTRRDEVVNSEEVTIAEYLKEAGYATGCFGKWHNGSNYPFDPTGQGFDEFWGFTDGIIRNYFDTRLKHNTQPANTEGYLTDFFTNKAISFIEKNRDQPLFCYLPYNVPHTPIQVQDSLFQKYLAKGVDEYTAGIYAMCEAVDYNLEKLLTTLRELELEENTIVFFLTDNGPNGLRFNGGMKGKKASIHEGGVRVPLFVQWKNHLPENYVVTELADHIDILPTVLDFCQISLPENAEIDGRSLRPLMTDEDTEWTERSLFSYLLNRGAVRTSQYRLAVNGEDILLYDMLADPAQLNNIANKLPDKTSELHQLYQKWLDDVKPDEQNPPVEIGHPQQTVVSLSTTGAQLHGNLVYKNKNGWSYDWMINWKSVRDRVSWDIKVVEAGTYEVFLQYLIPSGSEGATVMVKIGDQRLTKKIDKPFVPPTYPSLDNVDRGRAPEMAWQDFSWGTLKLSPGNYTLSVQATEIPNNQVGELYGVKVKQVLP
ncbi:MAG: sulfatase-like hydrolase/transferase [Bacteroidota bacterium]